MTFSISLQLVVPGLLFIDTPTHPIQFINTSEQRQGVSHTVLCLEPKLAHDGPMLSKIVAARVPTWHDLLLCGEVDRAPNRVRVHIREGVKKSSVWNKLSGTESPAPLEAARLNHAGTTPVLWGGRAFLIDTFPTVCLTSGLLRLAHPVFGLEHGLLRR